MRRPSSQPFGVLAATAALALLVGLLLPTTGSVPATAAATLPSGFREYTVLSGLQQPTSVEFASDGRIVIAEKSGTIKVFDNFDDTSPQVYDQLRTKVHNYWDRGMIGLKLPPNWPANPSIYVLYTHDAAIGGTAPRWGTTGGRDDSCPNPPGATDNGCVVSGRLSKIQLSGGGLTEQVLIEDWCQQFPSHSIGSLAFGADGQLYVSGGDGASFGITDYGQKGNPCGDPPGGTLTPPTAQGGALRSQDLRTSGDPTSLDGAVLRLNPSTGAASAGNPLAGSSDANARRIVAYGLRNPFRMTVRPGTNELYIGDVGWSTWEEIDRTVGNDATVDNFGWPCYEGNARQPGYDGANLSICENLYASGSAVPPLHTYKHNQADGPTDQCDVPGGSSVGAMAFYPAVGNYPSGYHGALFFTDYSRSCLWVMRAGAGGQPDPATRASFHSAANPVDLEVGSDGDLYYVSLNTGTLRRIGYAAGNQPPVGTLRASPTSGDPPLAVSLDARESTDPDPGDVLSFAWDLDNDGAFDDSTASTATTTFTTAGRKTVRLRVTDTFAATDIVTASIDVGRDPPAPVIDTPAGSPVASVGQTVSFSGHATDRQDGTLPAGALSWSADVLHCTGADACHRHAGVFARSGVASGSFTLPDHDTEAHIELILTATDSDGDSATAVRRIDYRKANVTFASSPAGVPLTLNGSSATAPFTRALHVAGQVSVSAPASVTIGGVPYTFASWSDGKPAAHDLTVPATATTYTATYRPANGGKLFEDNFTDGNADGWVPWRGSWTVCPPPGHSLAYCPTSTTTESVSLTGSNSWANYSVEAAVRMSTTSGGAMVLGRVRDSQHWYQLQLRRSPVSGRLAWYLHKRDGSSFATLASGPYNWAANTYYHLKLDMQGSSLVASVSTDGGRTFTRLGAATDASYPSGRIGVRGWGTRSWFDAVKVFAR
jgi:glucose/arabinose dehydrogenase